MREEMLDIFDQDGLHIGMEARSVVHRLGLWHQTFHCWIYRWEADHVELLFQKRHPQKDTCANLLDITSAGHLVAGEQPEDGVRELAEELGLDVAFEALQRIGVIRDVGSEPGIVDKELCHVFAYECGQPLDQYRVQEEEITGLLWVKLDEIVQLFAGQVAKIGACGFLRQEDGTNQRVELAVDKTAFVPHEEHYYRQVFDAVKKLAFASLKGA